MTLSYRPEFNPAEKVIASINTQQEQKVTEAEMMQAVRTLLIGLGEDPDREGLRDTPKRVMKALKFLTKGYHESLDELLNGAVFTEDANEMVLIFQYLLEAGSVTSGITTLDNTVSPQTFNIANPRQVIGVGNVGRKPGEATYTIYNPNSNQVEFKTVRYGISKGFGVAKKTVSAAYSKLQVNKA